ncbi:MAG: SH3-like domain-containing protein [Streptomycetales bacterium]
MAERFAAGERVRTTRVDPPYHTRLPRYARGAVGTVVELQGRYPLPDDRARGLATAPQPVYTVRFPAQELFGEGDHAVTVDLWESYLRRADDEGRNP